MTSCFLALAALLAPAPQDPAPEFAEPADEPTRDPQFRVVEGALPGPTLWTEGLALADVENDGDLDLFLARGEGWSGPGRVHQNGLFLNQLEEAPFRFADVSVERLGYSESHARDVATADVDADGLVDALFANGFNTAPPFLFINRADRPGFFRRENDTRGLTEALSSPTAAFGDVDDDGDLDLVLGDNGPRFLGTPGGRPRLYLNDGTGHFREEPDRLAAPLKVGSMGIHLADVDGDFAVDLLGPCRTDRYGLGHYLLLGDGSGYFRDASALLPETTGGVYEAQTGDLDGDRDVDLFFVSLARTEDPGSRFPLGEGPMVNGMLDGEEPGELRFTNGIAVGSDDDNDVVLLDHDADGDLDAFIGSLGAREKVLVNRFVETGQLAFAIEPGVIQELADPTLAMAAGDLDNDGDVDLVTVQGLERIGAEQPPCQVFENHGAPDQAPPRVLGVEAPERMDPMGPWVVHGAAQDDVLFDGETYVTAVARYALVADDADDPDLSTASTVVGLGVATALWRFELPDPAGSEPPGALVYQLVFTDRAGNATAADPVRVPLRAPERGRRRGR